MVLFLAFSLTLLPGLTAFLLWRGPRIEAVSSTLPPEGALPELAVLRDGAVGATRWAYAALLVKLARDGHCTLVRTRKRRWLRTGPTVTLDLHADPRALSPFEQTALRQLGRHDTLGGFGFAGSTFRRRTLRDVRADLVGRGWLADHRRRSNACLALGLVLLAAGGVGLLSGLSVLTSAASVGLGMGSLIAASVRFPVTETGAQRRAAHRAYAERQRERIQNHLSDRSGKTRAILLDALPALVLERIATPRWLRAVADRLSAAVCDRDDGALDAPVWVRDEIEGDALLGEACRTIAAALERMGARTPVAQRLRRALPGTRVRSE